MKDYSDKNVRNVCLVGHAGAGKTTLSELMLFKSGAITRLGKVEDGTTVSDFRAEEKDRHSSVFSSPLYCEWNENLLFFIDTPGFADFQGDKISAMATSDATLFVADAVGGLETGTIRSWKNAKSSARMFFINGMDKDNADYFRVLDSLQDSYGHSRIIPMTLPVGQGEGFSDVIHLFRTDNVPGNMEEIVQKYKTIVMDTVAEHDDELMMRYLDGEEISEEELSEGLHQSINDGSLVPVFVGSVKKDIGVTELMNGVINLLPRPWNGRFPDHEDGSKFEYHTSDGPAVVRVFKSINDPFVGQLTYVRIYSGMLKSDCEVFNISRDSKERIGSLLLCNGKETTKIGQAGPGCIVAIAKLKNTGNGDTLAMDSHEPNIVHITYPKPTVSHSVFTKKKGEEEKLAQALQRLSEENPTIRLEHQHETHEFICHAMGDLQFQIIDHRLKDEFGVEADFRTPRVPYRETITAVGKSFYRHKKQSGGSGQFGEVHMRLEPLPEAEYEFVSEVVGGSIPKNYFPGIEKGVLEAMAKGPLSHSKVINVKAVIYDGKYHPVDSNEMSFKIAGRGAFKAAMKEAKPVIMEPIMHLKVIVPDQYMGDVNGDLNQRRGRIMGMGSEDGLQVLEAEVPLSETFTYSQHLRSITQGRGSFEMEFIRYDKVPNNVAQAIIAAAEKEAEHE